MRETISNEKIRDVALELLRAERNRQIASGYDESHDDEHICSELTNAAMCYLYRSRGEDAAAQALWPFDGSIPKRKCALSDWISAAALIVAQIEVCLRSAAEAEGVDIVAELLNP